MDSFVRCEYDQCFLGFFVLFYKFNVLPRYTTAFMCTCTVQSRVCTVRRLQCEREEISYMINESKPVLLCEFRTRHLSPRTYWLGFATLMTPGGLDSWYVLHRLTHNNPHTHTGQFTVPECQLQMTTSENKWLRSIHQSSRIKSVNISYQCTVHVCVGSVDCCRSTNSRSWVVIVM